MTQRLEELTGLTLVTADLERLTAFYTIVLGLTPRGEETPIPSAELAALGLSGEGRRRILMLGRQTLVLEQYSHAGRPYPAQSSASSPWFQHAAIVVQDIHFAHGRLRDATPISSGGPQLLPASSGGVQAYKLRDPDGHPLELLQFPQDRTPAPWRNADGSAGQIGAGIDHSAIAVADEAASTEFYRALGLSLGTRTRNSGPAQDHLDGIAHVHVDVVALLPPVATPHLELLAYQPPSPPSSPWAANDIAATRINWRGARTEWLRDPDYHLHQIAP